MQCALLLLLSIAVPHTSATRTLGQGTLATKTTKTVLVWLQTQGQNDTTLSNDIAWAIAHGPGSPNPAITTVSPTTHHLGVNGTLETLPFAKGAVTTPASLFKRLREGGVRVLPILYNDESSSKPSTLLPKLHKLYANPGPFISAAVKLCVDNDLDGWNLDFEGANSGDGRAFAAFVNQFAVAMHKAGKVVSLDMVTASIPIWNSTLLNSSALDRAVNMGTYSQSYLGFVSSAAAMYKLYSPDKIGVGLGSWFPLSEAEVRDRFAVIEGLGNVQELDVWANRVPDSWLPYLQAFLK